MGQCQGLSDVVENEVKLICLPALATNITSNLAINDTLLNAAFELGGYSSKKETVNTALQEFIQRRKSEELMQLFGTIEYDADYDYKKLRVREQK